MSTSTSPVAGKVGQAFKFASSTNDTYPYVGLGTPSSLDLTGNITVTAWIKPITFGASSRGRIFDKNDNSGEGYLLSVDDFNVSSGLGFQTDTTVVTSNAGAVTLGVWQHVAATYSTSGNIVKFYVNGAPAGSGTGTTITSAPTRAGAIGRRASSSIRGFHGTIDDVRVYNRVLTYNEIQALYQSTK